MNAEDTRAFIARFEAEYARAKALLVRAFPPDGQYRLES
jgi:hypothetical protein